MSDAHPTFLARIREQVLAHLPVWITALIGTALTALLGWFGENIFDSGVTALGKTRILQLALLMGCLTLYLSLALFDRHSFRWDSRLGLYVHRLTDRFHCGSCRRPLRTDKDGWQCMSRNCRQFHVNPDHEGGSSLVSIPL